MGFENDLEAFFAFSLMAIFTVLVVMIVGFRFMMGWEDNPDE